MQINQRKDYYSNNRNYHSRQELKIKRKLGHVHDTPSVTVLKSKVPKSLKGEIEKEK